MPARRPELSPRSHKDLPNGNLTIKEAKEKNMETSQYYAELEKTAPILAIQLQKYLRISSARLLNRNNNEVRINAGLEWAKEFISWKLLSRLHRAEDLSKKDLENNGLVDEARRLAKEFLGPKNHHFFVTCIDGRNLPVIMLSHVPHFGGAIRTQAGELLGFKESTKNNSVYVDPDSFEAQAIAKLLLERAGETVFYSLDSHIGCAARGKLYQAEGGRELDGGLLADVRRKLKIAEGISNFAKEIASKGEKVADIIPQLFSYDPHDGTFYMGLEMHVKLAQSKGGFLSEVLAELSKKKQIISTWDFLKDKEIVAELEKLSLGQADFRNKFSESMLNNWKAITKLYSNGGGIVYNKIYRAIVAAYQNSSFEVGKVDNLSERKISYLAIENKAKVMLKNLVTRWSIAKTSHEWPFSEHLEQGIVITEGGFGPFESKDPSCPPDTFSVFAKEDLRFLLAHVKLAVESLIRPFRKNGKIKDPTNRLRDNDFVEAPVVVMNHAILRITSEKVWNSLEKIDFVEIFSKINWDDEHMINSWDKATISSMLKEKMGNISMTFAESDELNSGFWELFDRVRFMMDDPEFRSWVVKGKVLLVNKLVDKNRGPKIIAPMVF